MHYALAVISMEEVTLFAETNFRNQRRRFGIKMDDRRRHMYLIGKTGMGKTTVLENMIIADIRAGRGVGVVDPHGDLVEKVMQYIPSNRVNDVVYFNPADLDYPVAFNILETVEARYKHLVASGMMGVFKKLWPDVWSPRMEYILNNTILAMLDYPGSTMLGIQRMLSDKEFRGKVVEKITDPVVKSFWISEFAKYNERFAQEAIAPIQNKVGQFLSASIIRNIVGQVKSTINMRTIMDERKIFIMNLSKGRIGEDNSKLLGGLLITRLQLSAMERVDVPESERNDFYLYVDEFQNFATESFASILSEARKYHLCLILAHQYIAQLDEFVRPAIFGNVGTIVSYRVGAEDAEALAKEFAPRFTEEDLVNLGKFDMYLKLMIDGIASDPFSARGLPPMSDVEKTGTAGKVLQVSRERYSKPREIVEDKIARWSGVMDTEEEPAVSPMKKNSAVPYFKSESGKRKEALTSALTRARNFPREREVAQEPLQVKTQTSGVAQADKNQAHLARCMRCGVETVVSFVPDGIRPVYCKSCFTKMQEGYFAPSAKKDDTQEKRFKEDIPSIPKSISLQEALRAHPALFKISTRSGQSRDRTPNTVDRRRQATVPRRQSVLRPGQVIKVSRQ